MDKVVIGITKELESVFVYHSNVWKVKEFVKKIDFETAENHAFQQALRKELTTNTISLARKKQWFLPLKSKIHQLHLQKPSSIKIKDLLGWLVNFENSYLQEEWRRHKRRLIVILIIFGIFILLLVGIAISTRIIYG